MTAQNAGPVRAPVTPIERARKLCEQMGLHPCHLAPILTAFAEIAADERERCAVVAATKFARPHYHTASVAACHEIAAAIRRGDSE